MDVAYKPDTKFLGICISENMKLEGNAKLPDAVLSQFSFMISLKDITSQHK
jgi:hypothetical protein